MTEISLEVRRRRRLFALAAAVVTLAVGSFTTGAVVGANSPERDTARRFVEAWAQQDFAAMHAELTAASASRYALADFQKEYLRAQRSATVTAISSGGPSGPIMLDGRRVVSVPTTLSTTAFDEISGELELPVVGDRIEWGPQLTFPGLHDGEKLERHTERPQRAAILAADGTPLAEGDALTRASPLGAAADAVAGDVGPPDADQSEELIRQGFPPETPVGTSGLEKAFDARLAGTPGGELLAVDAGAGSGTTADGRPAGRTLASSDPVAGQPVRTTIDPELQEAAFEALAEQFGGIAVLDARKGSVLALAGIAYSTLQPPGSTFKIVTTVAALEGGQAGLDDTFPFETTVSVDGREIDNSDDALCGGSFSEAFAKSCNTVFAPLGAEIGGTALIDASERFGWNEPPTLFDAEATAAIEPPTSTIPDPLSSELEVAVSAIGQGKVQATPLQMASVAQTIAAGGVRSPTPLVKEEALRADAQPVTVTTERIAASVRELMVDTVTFGTGGAAALPSVQVAGKTGTAELRPKEIQPEEEPPPEGTEEEPAVAEEPVQEIDAWFTGFAPAERPRIAIAVMIANAEGGGGAIAAPIAAQVLAAWFAE